MASIREEIALMEAERSRASSELSMVKSDRARLESELHSIEGIELEFNDTKVRMESVKSSLIVVSDSLERMVKRLEGRDAASIAAEKTAIENEIRDMRKWSSDSEKSLQLKRQEMAELNGRMRLETESADSMNRLGAKCPVCESEISDERKSSLH